VNYEIANPHPAGTIESLKSLGYTIEAAIADLVDNSITAQARHIDIVPTWDGRESWIAVVDDGNGMTEADLVTAMTIAAKGPRADRGRLDLGRFGMGLKTASFSQARQLIVTTAAPGGPRVTRAWDLDLVIRSGEWRLLRDVEQADAAILDRLWRGQGTVVLWRHLHRFDRPEISVNDAESQRHFYDDVRMRVEPHLGMVFHRYLERTPGIGLTVNGNPVQSWDPFLRYQQFVRRLPPEHLPISGHVMDVEGFVLPHPRHLSEEQAQLAAGPGGWLDQQGFYVYRRDRLIVAGSWLGIRGFRKEDKYMLARIGRGASTSVSPRPCRHSQHGRTCAGSGKKPAGERRQSSAIAGGSQPESMEPNSSTHGKSGRATARSPVASTVSTHWCNRYFEVGPASPLTRMRSSGSWKRQCRLRRSGLCTRPRR
jgi:hypothetical protein